MASAEGGSQIECVRGCRGQVRHPFSLRKLTGAVLSRKLTPERSDHDMKLKIKLGKQFEFSFKIEKAVVLALLMMIC